MTRVEPLPEAAISGPEFRRILGRRPEVLARWEALTTTLRFSGTLEPELKEAVRQATAGRIGCEYCASVGERLGAPDARTSLAVAVAQMIADDRGSVDETTFAVLREEFDEGEIVELLAVICFLCLGGQAFGNLMDVAPASAEEQDAYIERMAERRAGRA